MKKSLRTLIALSSAALLLAQNVQADVAIFDTEDEAHEHVVEVLGEDALENRDFIITEDEDGQWVAIYGPEFEEMRGDAKFLVLNPVDDEPAAGVKLEVSEGMDHFEVVTDEEGIAYFKNLDPDKDYVAQIVEAPEGFQYDPEFIHPFRVIKGEVKDFTYGVVEEDGAGLEDQDLVFDTADEARQAAFQAYKQSDEFDYYRVDQNADGKWYFTLQNEMTEDNESGFTHEEDANQAAYDALLEHPEFKHYSLNKIEGKWYYELTEELEENNKTGYTDFDDAVEQAKLAIKEEPRFVDFTIDEVEGKFYYTLFESKEEADKERNPAFSDARIDEEEESKTESTSQPVVTSETTTEKKDQKGNLPDTGENSSFLVIALGLLAAIAGFVVLALPRLRKRNEE